MPFGRVFAKQLIVPPHQPTRNPNKIMYAFKKVYQFIASRGVSEQKELEDKLTSSLNILSVLTAFGSFSIFFFTFFLTDDYVYMAVTLGVTITYLLLPIFHHFHLIRFAKIYFAVVIPFWYVITMLTIGGVFSQSIAAAATIMITFLMFRKEDFLRNIFIVYNLLLYIIPTLYITMYQPVFGVRNYPVDEIVVFLLCMGWMSIVFLFYEQETQSQIGSLEQANKDLKQQSIELERFAYIASHDLKSPLRNINSFLNLIKRKIKQEDYQDLPEYIEYAETGALQMSELIKAVLEITTIDQDHGITSRSNVDLNACLKKVLLNLNNEIEEKQVIIEQDDLPNYFCNETHLLLILQNIIQNGIKYNNSSPPRIKIRSRIENKNLIIEIEDNGIGIEKEFHDQIFVFFKRLHTTNEYIGTGLGLGLVKKLVDRYNGKISVSSILGKQTIFRIQLPVHKLSAVEVNAYESEVYS